jgi:hypothetical protein
MKIRFAACLDFSAWMNIRRAYTIVNQPCGTAALIESMVSRDSSCFNRS